MNILKHTMKILFLTILLSFTSCEQQKYPDLQDGLYAEFVTNQGIMVAKLNYKEVPVTVANFVGLAEGTQPNLPDSLKGKRYYDGTTFHRVIDKFMIQGGDPTGSGSGNPGYSFLDEFHPDLKHNKPGILSMANSGPATNGSQFFITEVPTPNLDNRHAVFGELVIGLEVQDTISNVAVSQGNNKPVEPVVIETINIIRVGTDAEAFDAAKVFAEDLPKIEERQKQLKEEEQAKMKESAKQAGEEFLKKNEAFAGTIKELPTGLIMIVTEAENGVKPNSSQKVLVNYAGYFEDGRLFDTSWAEIAKENNQYNEQRDTQGGYKPFPMIYNETAQLVPGFREAMLNMNVGDKARVFIPSYLGYGANGMGPIPPNTNLVFDLEISGLAE
ncbi:cyclophilin family peptidyl-prolyl cis-trans isomerase [Xanthomarina spongicola]|uniref:peptidylprolyl isomerase n=2 Tax=Xanthomarina spongicola TaxID=570520 RepID=A0A316DLS5_9FLAO|nr:cyclophilin family peptidyl-prolyl cis-trans isomerase [Xanthomarina spongicola]